MSVFFAVYLPDRYHLLLVPRSTSALRRFLRTLNSELGHDLGDHLGWKPRQWPVRYWVAVCGEGEAAQVAKLKQLSELALTDSVFFTPLECQRNT